MLSKVSVHEVFMHYFETVSSASRAWPQTPLGSAPGLPLDPAGVLPSFWSLHCPPLKKILCASIVPSHENLSPTPSDWDFLASFSFCAAENWLKYVKSWSNFKNFSSYIILGIFSQFVLLRIGMRRNDHKCTSELFTGWLTSYGKACLRLMAFTQSCLLNLMSVRKNSLIDDRT